MVVLIAICEGLESLGGEMDTLEIAKAKDFLPAVRATNFLCYSSV